MSHLPVIVGFGGINPAGRSSSHHSYRRLVFDKLSSADADSTLINLAVLMGLLEFRDGKWLDANNQVLILDEFLVFYREQILSSTLVRKLEKNLFDNQQLYQHSRACLSPANEGEALIFSLPTRNLPEHIPDNWVLSALDERNTRVEVHGKLDLMFKDFTKGAVNSAGQLPSGFDPGKLYPSRNHPRALQMTVYGASDALLSMGLDWELIRAKVPPDQISVYAGSSMGQLDFNGTGGMLQSRLLGKKVTSKQLPLGFSEMPADFINAYMLGNVGNTGAMLGACASFHYNLRQGLRDIRNGTHRVVIVGGSEAPITPEIMEAFVNMGALSDDAKLRELDQVAEADYRRACRPFGVNAGFTLSESAQFVILFDDALALELGANIYGSINDVFVNADGYKKSIAGPGIGNYVTMAKAAAATKAVLGEEALRRKTYVQAHGTGTPQNRVTESAIFSDIAKQFGIQNWPITAIKSYLGHSICCAGADQLITSLGVWKYGIIPGIANTKAIAEDVSQQGLDFLLEHKEVQPADIDAVILNAKGFGGNNATASMLSPLVTERMLQKKHGKQLFTQYQHRNEEVFANSEAYAASVNCREMTPIYKFDHDVKEGEDLSFLTKALEIDKQSPGINLDLENPYPDMCE